MDINLKTNRCKMIQRLEEIDIFAIQVLLDYKDDPFFKYIQFMEPTNLRTNLLYLNKNNSYNSLNQTQTMTYFLVQVILVFLQIM